MPVIKSLFIATVLMSVLSACVTAKETIVQTIVPTQHDNLHSTLWVQTAAEYRANTIQTFRLAAMQLDQAINKGDWRAMLEQKNKAAELPTAIVLDVDETVLDNSPYQAMMIQEGIAFEPVKWDEWVALAQAEAIPGAVDLINTAIDKGVVIIYLTNRECIKRPDSESDCPQIMDTAKNLEKVGIKSVDPDMILLKSAQPDWVSEKKSRRVFLADKYRVMMLFGDDFGDFLPNVKKNITHEKRAMLVDKYKDMWGTKWFVFPNPTYGSWQGVLPNPRIDNLKSY